jgi:hypothetical protein
LIPNASGKREDDTEIEFPRLWREAMKIHSKLTPISLYFFVFFVAIFIGSSAAMRTPAGAHLDPYGHTWPYSLNSSCSANNPIDPIGTVFWNVGSATFVASHAGHHGYGTVDV